MFRPINTVGLPATVLEIGSGVVVVGKVMGKAFDVGTIRTPLESLRVLGSLRVPEGLQETLRDPERPKETIVDYLTRLDPRRPYKEAEKE